MSTLHGDRVTVNLVGDEDLIDFNTPLLPDGAAVWRLDTLDGWANTPDLDVNSTPWGGNVDGESLGDAFAYAGRQVLISGYVIADTRAKADSLKDMLLRDVFPRNTDLQISRYESTPKFIRGRVFGGREIQEVGPNMFRFAIPFLCGDPFKYGLTPSTDTGAPSLVTANTVTFPLTFPVEFFRPGGGGDNINLYNSGSTNSKPVITVTGPVTGAWRLTNHRVSKSLTIHVNVPTDDDTLIIDFKTEVVTLNGIVQVPIMFGEFWSCKPGSNLITLDQGTIGVGATYSGLLYSAWE